MQMRKQVHCQPNGVENNGGAMKLFRANYLVLSVFVVLLLAGFAQAQNASVSGTVQDSSGAAVASATVTVTNLATTVSRAVTTNHDGIYRIEPLPPGDYSLTVEKDGFKSVSVDKLTLTVDQKFTFNTTLQVGGVSTKIEVSAETIGAVDTETATLSNVIDEKQMADLPLILRDPYQLVLLGPGVTQSDGMGGVSVNGGRERNNNFQLDGVDNNDTDVPGTLGGLTSQNPDSTEEFRVLTNNFAPEFGRNNGAIIDVVTKSGTNDLHGSVYYFGRWDALGARDFFNHQIDPITNEVAAKDPYVRNLYGATIGGPIIKGKTFYFLNYQGDRFITNLTNSSTVPTEAFKTGIFTYVNPEDGNSVPINVTAPGANQNATGASLDPVMQKILALYPAPTSINSDNVSGQLIFPSESREKDEDATLKIDHTITQNNRLSVRYIYNWFNDPNPFHDDFLPGDLGAVSSPQRTQGLAVSLISTPTPTLSHELRLGANRANFFFGCTGTNIFDSLGLVDSQGRGADYTLPGFAGFGCQALGDTDAQDSKQGTYSILDTLTKVVGSHTFKFGGEHRRVYSNNYTSFSSRQTLSFNIFSGFGIPTLMNLQNQNGQPETNVPDLIQDEVSALLGLVNQASQTQFFNNSNVQLKNDANGYRQRELAFFGQDIWKVRPNLSFTYGLRWEWYGVPVEENNILSNLFQDPSSAAPAVDPSNCGGATPCTGFTFQPVGPGTGHQLYKDYYRNFEPRVGFAWDPFHDGKTSIRGGIGAFSDRIYGNLVEDARGDPPFQPSYFNFPSFFNGPGPAAQLSSQTTPPSLSLNPVVVNEAAIFPDLFSQNMKPPYVVTWNFGIQREIKNVTLEVNYVGNHGTRIIRVVDGNPPQPALVSQNLATCEQNPAAQPNPVQTCEADLQFNTLYFGSALNPPSVNNNAFVHTFTDQTTGYSYYDGLQVQATMRPTHGLQLNMAYTWSHAIDNSSDPLVTTLGNGNYPVDSFDLERERGNSGFDTRQRAVMNFTYQFGVGRGSRFLNQGLVGKVFEGWQLAGIAQWQGGLPYDIFGFVDTLHTGIADRATIINPSAFKQVPSTGTIYPGGAGKFTGFNLGAFNNDLTSPPFDQPAGEVRNAFYGPGINNWDMNFSKTTKITEKVDFQLRWEVYNLFNRPHFAKPDNNIGDALFGYSTGQVGQNDGTTGARQMQIGARLSF
jgi:hypothetical protein